MDNLLFSKLQYPQFSTRDLNRGPLDLKTGALPLSYKLGPVCQRWGKIVFNAKGRANEIGQSWCPADLSVTNYRYQSEANYRPYANTCSIAAATHTWVLFIIAH